MKKITRYVIDDLEISCDNSDGEHFNESDESSESVEKSF